MESLEVAGANINQQPLVVLKANPYLGKFILKQSDVKLSLGRPVIETTLHDAESGMKIFTARDEDAETLASAKYAFTEMEFNCIQDAMDKAKAKTKAVVDTLGYLE